MSLGFTKSKADPSLYPKVEDGMQVILLLYVDDMFLTSDEELITDSKRKLAAEFEMKDLGPMHYFLGLEVWQKPSEIILSQGKYAMEILKRFGMMDCKSMSTPMTTNLKLFGDVGQSESCMVCLSLVLSLISTEPLIEVLMSTESFIVVLSLV